MKQRKNLFWFIIALTIVCLVIDLPKVFKIKFQIGKFKIDQNFNRPEFDFKIGNLRFKKDLDLKYGLDLAGGSHLILQADMKKIAPEDKDKALEAAKEVIERRINFFGVTEPNIQTSKLGKDYRIIVELPGIQNINEAIDLIGQTAQLNFREEGTGSAKVATPSAFNYFGFINQTNLTGKHLKKAEVSFDPNTGKPEVSLEFNSEGAKLFEEITRRNVGKQVAIFLDNLIISAPKVNETISGGKARITGEFSLNEAKKLAIQLNAGALPVPVKVIEQKTVGATLGKESLEKSFRAGIIGLLAILFFMWVIYGRLGLIANLALIIYGLLTLAIYKLIPVTLTLPGVAGFILTVGMAVDANILIFERFKEEIRRGKPWQTAIELAFGRAWDSIKDANVCTIITALVLLNPTNFSFLNSAGMVKGFALTLLIGVICSLFTGIVVSRNLIRTFYRQKNNK